MPIDPKRDRGLSRFRAALGEIYGKRLARVVLYGSRARGDERPESDYDVAVFLRDMADRAGEMKRLADLETDIFYATGALINALPFHVDAEGERSGFMHELRKDGLDL